MKFPLQHQPYLWWLSALVLVTAALLGIALWGSNHPPDPATIARAAAVAPAMNQFGLKLASVEAASRPQQNVFISPLSIFNALGMAESGAAGATRQAMRQTLNVPEGFSEDQLHGSISAMLKVLRAENGHGAELSIANAVWSDTGLPLSPAFIRRCKDLYVAQAQILDLGRPASADTINDWVRKHTHQKISEIVSPESLRGARVVLTNAVYFHGQWSHQFPVKETRPAPFHLAGGGTKTVQMMHQSDLPGAWRQGEGFEAAALDYRDSHLRLYAILPGPGVSPEDALARVSLEQLSAPGQKLNLYLPRVTLEFSAQLNDPLAQMGMSPAFQPDADFSAMGPRGIYISQVVHKTFLAIDEEGTTAAAATGVIGVTSFHPPRTLVFDRPFALVLCDTQTNAILFAGVIYQPPG